MTTANSSKIESEKFLSDIEGYDSKYINDITSASYFGFPTEPILNIENRLLNPQSSNIAYFSMEFGIAPSIYNTFKLSKPLSIQNQFYTHEVFSNYWLCDYLFKIKIDKMLDIPIYGGGLGVLAGDTMKSCADEGYPVVGIGVLWNKGYFKQKFWYKHGQVPEELSWDPASYPGLIPLKGRVCIDTKEGKLYLRLWKYYIFSHDKKFACPLVLLDSNVDENSQKFKMLTDQLYRSDDVSWKIYQRMILGIGGMKALEFLNYPISTYHLNEGHAAFALVQKYVGLENKEEFNKAKKQFVYTCHTPVIAGHDRFAIRDIEKIFKTDYVQASINFGREEKNENLINLTEMALKNCRQVNAVAQKHGEVMRIQFPDYEDHVQAITNGIHIPTWVSTSFAKLFDQYSDIFGDWRNEQKNLERILELKSNQEFRKQLFEAHAKNKSGLMKILKPWKLNENILTVGWARRIAGYKRPALIFHNVKQLIKLTNQFGKLQIILAGKAHPNDDIGGAHIDEILDHIDQLNDYKDQIKILILENYDTYFGKLLTNSVDVWLNNPLPPFEASGTSGMKAIVNGVVQVSTLDGWVVEAEHDDIGWIFGYRHAGGDIGTEDDLKLNEDSQALYETLGEVAKLYYDTNQKGQINTETQWIDKMIHCVYRSAFFNTQRMVREYKKKMWDI